ncbi:MAG TPA: alpha/beta hydrolase [Hyphomicrobiaceae bacterium]|nr:alpha/beta hydrolase [Hyphomicrobiaceae bacterium]
MLEPDFQSIASNGIRLRVALSGKGPLVILVHGWPESWYSWRHQISALAAAGYRVAAPDVRGYGGSDKPAALEAYAIKEMCADVAGLVTALGETRAILIGHDWGAPIVWNTALFYPERVRAVVGLSVPHTGRGPAPRIQLFRKIYKDRFFYQIYFQTPGVAEAELEADVRTSLRKVYYWVSGEAIRAGIRPHQPAGGRLLDGLLDPDPFPAWLTPADLDYYVGEFQGSGFRGPLNRYRTSELDFAQQAAVAEQRLEQPAAFIAGSLDPVLRFIPGVDLIDTMRGRMGDLRLVRLIEGAGHWVQQERPAEVNAALTEFLDRL